MAIISSPLSRYSRIRHYRTRSLYSHKIPPIPALLPHSPLPCHSLGRAMIRQEKTAAANRIKDIFDVTCTCSHRSYLLDSCGVVHNVGPVVFLRAQSAVIHGLATRLV